MIVVHLSFSGQIKKINELIMKAYLKGKLCLLIGELALFFS